MPTAIARLKSVSQYSQSRYLLDKRADNETWDAFEERIWRKKAHVNADGKVIIPPMSFKQAIDAAAKYAGLKIPGKRNATYTKHFASGVIIESPIVLPITPDQLDYYAGPMNSDGKRGSGSRVIRIFPIVQQWEGDLHIHIFDSEITKDVLAQVLEIAGKNIGVGRFRPQNGGFNGRFTVEKLEWNK